MGKRKDIKKVLIIGSGPIVIGQACEFDYSGTQACKALRKLGYKIILVNSNPATIMTDPGMADVTYIEPLNVQALTEIIENEKPDAILPNLGGQTGLNLTSELHKKGILKKHNVQVIGVQVDAIERGEDRIAFKETMKKLGIDMPKSEPATSVEEAEKIAAELGYPVVVRPAYTMGGTGGGLVYNLEELRVIASRGISASLIGQILIEESVIGWEELELEVVRDAKGQMITVCFIENVDAMGVHTGDSYCTAPMLTISEDLQKRLQKYSYDIVEAIQVIGGTNVQFAHDPKTDRVVVIEINPRTSRSSALASKATGFPIALISSMLAAGLTLEEIPYWREGTLDKYTPSGDYVVVKFARWDFEKFGGAQDKLGTQMRAVGEVMSIGKNYKEAFQKAIRSLEKGRYGLGFVKDFNKKSLDDLMEMLAEPSSERQFIMYEALRKGATVDALHAKTYIKKWFIRQMKELVELEEKILTYKGKPLPNDLLIQSKKDGFADRYLAQIVGKKEEEIRKQRLAAGLAETWDAVPVSGVENATYYYSTYNAPDTVSVSSRRKIMVLGGGPNRIGQGIEFDYCCVHAAFALRDEGYESIMVNCNPETVSTDYDTSDKLYFEPLTVEDVLSIYEKEKPEGVICQFGGQTPLNIAADLAKAGVKIIGTSPETIDLAEDRDRFREMMEKLGIPMPASGMASNLEQALKIAKKIGYPLMVRPSYVLGGRGMEVVHDEEMLKRYVTAAVGVTPERPILIDKFLENAIEAEADAISDGTDAFVPAVMEHIELAGVHSGDSACVIPPISIPARHIDTINDYTKKIAVAFGVVGLMNIQYAIANDIVYILEANPRASRTVPLVSKVCNISMARVAAQIMLGKKLKDLNLKNSVLRHFGVKEAVFPFNMYQEVDPVLGPEMRSTGEVLGLADSFGLAYFKAQEATGQSLPGEGVVLITVADTDKSGMLEVARAFEKIGFKIRATEGTHKLLAAQGIASEPILKMHEGRPNIVDAIKNGEIQLVINTPAGRLSKYDDSYIRKAAIKYKIPYITTTAAAVAAVKGITAFRQGHGRAKSLQSYHKEIK
ncbi:MAG TPA: carbamoyl-phosphate synthase large subunit [Smithellaceae bacterium]|jgi:carbamoyl-phosphate synthase large subunit|nr:carbamoyl-phosphate synthase large subunit [Smithellaceae bacterium]HOD31342.1 carbamoyl-phosphate synthase large subunit [Smithellaceae bacterium]HOF77341.1 carbamoyl-phosphate synthase large subunit [Smithellaceae bacterium]HOM70301.1 carbamoyl-phosphate synthase large subunit [Smithellaceae bacterium]HOU03820.1 carbamoyl-phosphate synthase large subunit [Smithellaceae bacterium]